jgi:uncharacterized protein YndB with AHSA1/START domain
MTVSPELVSTIDIAVPPAEVFAFATDPTTFAEWQFDVVRVRMNSGDAATVGSRFETVRRIGGAERAMTQEITDVTAPRTWAARGVDGPVRPRATVTIEPLPDGNGSRATFTLDFQGRGLGNLLLPMVRRMAAKGAPVSYRRLKELLESRHTKPASL